jgi:3-oxoacyl-[acyl-carrier protein] reductase
MTNTLSDEVKKTVLRSIPVGFFGKPSDIAKAALYLASEESSFVTGQVITVDGGMVM